MKKEKKFNFSEVLCGGEKWTHLNLIKPSASIAKNLVETAANATFGFTVTYRLVSGQMNW
jgi:hypothetical protein